MEVTIIIKKLYVLGLSLLILSILPTVAVGGELDLQQQPIPADPLPVARVFGFFPHANSEYLVFLEFPSFQIVSIPQEDFQGYIGFIIIFGMYDPSPEM